MKKKAVDIVAIGISTIILFFLIKYFYFDTKIGFDISILELQHSSFPMCFDILVFVIITPLLFYEIIQQFYSFIVDRNTN